MKLFFLALTVILFSSFPTFAQTETPDAADWKTFAPENEEFSIESPVSLNAGEFPVTTAPGLPYKKDADASRRFSNSLNGTYFYIFSDDWRKLTQYRFVLDFVNSQNQLESNQFSGEFPAQRFEFSDESSFYHTILTVNGKDRVYVFHAVSPTKENLLVERFINSLKISEKPLAEALSKSKIDKKVSVTITDAEPEVKLKAPAISGVTGDRSQAQTDSKSPTPTPNGESNGVQILSKPRANYTNFARFYEMTGKVRLRVTFSANGMIGSITTLSKLPFGLTQTAIEAVRGIRFTPAMYKGVSVSITKPVEYTFTIF